MSDFSTILFSKEGLVAHISLNRPQVLNAYNVQMRDEFAEVLTAVRDDPDVRVLLISGQGRAFCAGADLTEFGSAPSLVIARQARFERDVWDQLIQLTKPIVAAVHGYCIGTGMEIALLSDLRIATAGAVFAMPEVRLGMIPAAGGTQTLARACRASATLDLLLTGRRFDADEALSLGLITRVVPMDNLLEVAWLVSRQLAEVDNMALSFVKSALRQGTDMTLSQGLQLETRLAALALSG